MLSVDASRTSSAIRRLTKRAAGTEGVVLAVT
jgi:hypothetical protein